MESLFVQGTFFLLPSFFVISSSILLSFFKKKKLCMLFCDVDVEKRMRITDVLAKK